MTLSFPNPSRSYDAAKGYVRFWGSDSSLEVSFNIDREALQRMSPALLQGEDAVLKAFDFHRPRIERVARDAYLKRRSSYHHLAASDF